jgi:hypothetical protein
VVTDVNVTDDDAARTQIDSLADCGRPKLIFISVDTVAYRHAVTKTTVSAHARARIYDDILRVVEPKAGSDVSIKR